MTLNAESPLHDSNSGAVRPTDGTETHDAKTITDVLDGLDGEGFEGQFRAIEGGRVECFTCRQVTPATEMAIEQMSRLEGASDPADMVTILAVTCPKCSTHGTLLLGYGPDSTIEDSEVLRQLGDERSGSGVPQSDV